MENKRLISLDVLRGLTVALMITVNNGGGKMIYSTLEHSKWNGMTPCDLVFPFFLFIMGISTFLSFKKSNFTWSKTTARKIAKRTILIFLIGLILNWFGLLLSGKGLDFEHLRIWGVMQRIALCYLAVSIFALSFKHKYIPITIVVLLAIYSAILILGNGYAYDSNLNILSKVDINIFGYEHLYHKSPVDPEGLLSTIPAIAHTMIGFYCGKLMASARDTEDKVMKFMIAGGILVIIGYLVSFGLPLNKRIWSPSYVCMTCGLAAICQGLLMYYIDIKGIAKEKLNMALIFGTNPLFLYVVSELVGIIFGATGLKIGIYNGISTVVINPYMASLVYAILFMLLNALMGYPLWKKHIFIKL